MARRLLAASQGISSAQAEAFKTAPDKFSRDVFGIETWNRQTDILNAVRDHKMVAVRSGHKTGKSMSAAILALWWISTRRGQAIMTAPTGRQIRDVLWPEVRACCDLARRRGMWLGADPSPAPHAGLRIDNKWGLFGFATDKPERFAGISGPDLLFIVDEASGFNERIFQAIFGSMAGEGSRVVLLGNPTHTSGTFYDAFHDRRDGWCTIHIKSTETPNFFGGRVPGLADAIWHKDVAIPQWGGPGDQEYQVRVLGDFPTNMSNAVIQIGMVEDARRRFDDLFPDDKDPTNLDDMRSWFANQEGDLQLGVDVARFGDDRTVIFPRRGSIIFPPKIAKGKDTVFVTGMVVDALRALRRPDEVPTVVIDDCGVGGGVTDQLNEHLNTHANAFRVIPINAAETAADDDQFANMRAQLTFELAKWLGSHGAIPKIDRLESELVAATYDYDHQQRRRIQPKAEIKKRLGRSPDLADALALATYEGSVGGYFGDLPDPVIYESPLAGW